MSNDYSGLAFFQFLTLPKSPENTHGRHPCPVAGLHISGGIPHIEDLLRLQPHQIGNFFCSGWIRLSGYTLTLAKNKIKDIGSEQSEYLDNASGE